MQLRLLDDHLRIPEALAGALPDSRDASRVQHSQLDQHLVAAPKVYECLGRQGLEYVIGLPSNTVLTPLADVTEHVGEAVTSDADGWAEFRCPGRSVSVRVPQRG